MRDVISNAVSKLSEITDQIPIDWDAFDSVLKDLEDVNACDDSYEETILSELIMDGNFFHRGTILADIIRHFLSCGYDVSANDGLNGGLALRALCWSSYDQHILDAAKVLMNAGAPAIYRTKYDDPNDEPEGLLGSIGWKLPGAWMVDKDFAFANTLEAYYAMTEANIAGRDINFFDTYLACIGKNLSSVSAIKADGKPALYDEGAISVFSEPLILWFEDKPLVVNCYTELAVNPVYADNKKSDLADVTTLFSTLIGSTLQEVQYIGTTICYFEFSNGKRLFFASRGTGNRKRVGTFDILPDSKMIDVAQLRINCICAINALVFADTTTEYSEDAVALFCNDAAYLLYLRPGTTDRYQLDICPCTKALLTEYTRQYPLQQPIKTTWIYDSNNLSAVCLDFPEGHLYMVATEFNDIEIQLSDKVYNPLDYSVWPCQEGKHIEFLKRKDGD